MTPDQRNRGGAEPDETMQSPAGSSPPRESTGAGRVGDTISHYRIERRLGAGGMGQVFLVQDLALGRPAALKVLPDSFSPQLRERLFREAWASARVQHPSIATFYEAGEADGIAFIALEFVEGRTLKEEIETRGSIPLKQAVGWTSMLLEGLAHAHAASILHRDIKPANIMCQADGHVKLLDFGLARHADPISPTELSTSEPDLPEVSTELVETFDYVPETEKPGNAQLNSFGGLTRHGAIVGTFGYMSPEQLCGREVDVRTDIFAVGAVFYEMLTGLAAFPGNTARERMRSTMHSALPVVDVGDQSADINRILQRATAKQATARYESASEFLRDLRKLFESSISDTNRGRIAVLDFHNESNSESLDWFASGLPDLLSEQFRQRGLEILPRATAVAARQTTVGTDVELGLHLGVRWLIAGRYSAEEGTVTVGGRLIDVPARRVALEFEFPGTWENLSALPERITHVLVEHFHPAHTIAGSDGEGKRHSAEAYENYVRGRRELFQYGKGSFDRAEEFLNRAVELDPTYAEAWAGLSQIAGMRFLFSRDPKTLDRAVDFANQGIESNPKLPDPWVWLGYALAQRMFHEFRLDAEGASVAWSEAKANVLRAFELDPASPIAAYFAASFEQVGCRFANDAQERKLRRTKALALYQRNLEIAPQSCWSWLGIGWLHLDLGNPTEAEWCMERAVELEPKVTPPTAGVAVFLGEALRRIGKLGASREQSLQGLEATESTDHMYRDTFRGVGLCALGRTSLQLKEIEAATAAFRQAVLHLRGRTYARVGGQLLVQALAGLTRAGQGPGYFEEAVDIYTSGTGYEFGWLWWGWDEITLLELSRAAGTLGRKTEAAQFLEAAVRAGSVEALEDSVKGTSAGSTTD